MASQLVREVFDIECVWRMLGADLPGCPMSQGIRAKAYLSCRGLAAAHRLTMYLLKGQYEFDFQYYDPTDSELGIVSMSSGRFSLPSWFSASEYGD